MDLTEEKENSRGKLLQVTWKLVESWDAALLKRSKKRSPETKNVRKYIQTFHICFLQVVATVGPMLLHARLNITAVQQNGAQATRAYVADTCIIAYLRSARSPTRVHLVWRHHLYRMYSWPTCLGTQIFYQYQSGHPSKTTRSTHPIADAGSNHTSSKNLSKQTAT